MHPQDYQLTLMIKQKIDVSDEKKWHKANIILKVFPGTVTEVSEDEHA